VLHLCWQTTCTCKGMASKTSTPTENKTELVTPEKWREFFTKITKEYRGAHAKVEVMGGETGYNVMTEHRPFDGISADTKDGESSVWITFENTPSEPNVSHGVHHVTFVRVLSPGETTGAVVEIEANDKTRTLLSLSRPGDFELPPAQQNRGKSR
jgi:Family of unknown function (DUF5335)